MKDVLNKKVISFNTGVLNGTFVIGASFIFIAYFLHPVVESAYQRVRAYRAWRAIEKRQAVEVTNYPMLAETLGARGKWDTARVITILLAVFSLLCWGLELSMNVAYHKGDADILSQSPPIFVEEASDGTSTWKVTPETFFDWERVWKSLSNVGERTAQSKYNIVSSSTCGNGYIDGNIDVAVWSDTTETAQGRLHYLSSNDNGSKPVVTSLQCKADTQSNAFDVSSVDGGVFNGNVSSGDGNVYWGTGVECVTGPALEGKNSDTPPTIILNKTYEGGNTDEGYTTDENVYLVVEEASNYPSFLYSVWTANNTVGHSIRLNHEFHIATTMRLAEAVVTGIVHGQVSGRYCFELVRMFSETGDASDSEDTTRAEPFGEHPKNHTVKIEHLENIECGMEVNQRAAIFLACLFLLTAVGIGWSLCLRATIGMDIYDRDELIRAVSMPGVTGTCAGASSIRIFVRKEDMGKMSVAISDAGDGGGGCAKNCRRGDKVIEETSPAPQTWAATVQQYNHGFGGAAVPVGPRAVWLEGVRTGMGRALPGRNSDFCYPTSVALVTSPVPSSACSLVESPFHNPPPLVRAPRERLGFARREGLGVVPREDGEITRRRGASVLFDSGCSSDDSGDGKEDVFRSGGNDGIKSGVGTQSAGTAGPGGVSFKAARPPGALRTLIERSSWMDRSGRNGVLGFSSGSSTSEADASVPSHPPFLVRGEQTL